MPPFPDLDAEQITQVTTFIRNSWSNEYGGVDASQVVALLDVFKVEIAHSSIWDGIFTSEQANRGEIFYNGACALCHGKKLDGAPADPDMNGTPPIGRYKFLRNWDGKSLATLQRTPMLWMPTASTRMLQMALADSLPKRMISWTRSAGCWGR